MSIQNFFSVIQGGAGAESRTFKPDPASDKMSWLRPAPEHLNNAMAPAYLDDIITDFDLLLIPLGQHGVDFLAWSPQFH